MHMTMIKIFHATKTDFKPDDPGRKTKAMLSLTNQFAHEFSEVIEGHTG